MADLTVDLAQTASWARLDRAQYAAQIAIMKDTLDMADQMSSALLEMLPTPPDFHLGRNIDITG